MADVLSQDQIDALLHSVIDNESSEPESVLEDMSKKERRYDFRAPKVFTKDSLKFLDGIYTNYARILSSHLTSMLRLTCEVELLDIEEQNFGELSNALGENDALAVIDIDESSGYDENEPVVMQISNDIIYIMIDRMLGGAGEVFDDVTREFTTIELNLYNDFLKNTIPLMSDAWKNYFNIKFSFSNIEVNPRLMQRLSLDTVVVIIVMNITINDITGKVNICLPGNVFEFILEALAANRLSVRRKDGHGTRAADDILHNISGSALEIKVDFGESQVMLSDILNLKAGDIINLNKPNPSSAIVYIEDKPWFTADLGAEKYNKAVKINGFITK